MVLLFTAIIDAGFWLLGWFTVFLGCFGVGADWGGVYVYVRCWRVFFKFMIV